MLDRNVFTATEEIYVVKGDTATVKILNPTLRSWGGWS